MKTDKVGKRTAVFQVSRVSEKRWFSFFFFFLYVNRSVSGARSWWAVRVRGLDYARVCVCVFEVLRASCELWWWLVMSVV